MFGFFCTLLLLAILREIWYLYFITQTMKGFVMKTLFTGICVFCLLLGQSQTIMFPNNNSALLLMNPSFAGTSGGTRVQSNGYMRDMTESFRSGLMQASVDHYINSIQSGIGLSFVQQSSKFFSASNVYLNWAQHFVLSPKHVKIIPSISIGMRRTSLDPTFFISSVSQAPQKTTHTRALLGASVLLELHERFYIGIVVRDQNIATSASQSKIRFSSPAIKGLNVSYNLQLSKKELLQAVIRLSTRQGFTQTHIGLNYLHKHILVGAGIASGDVSYLQLGFKNQLFCKR